MPRFTESRTRCGFSSMRPPSIVIDAQHEAVGVLALFAQLDKAGDGHARSRKAQHRMGRSSAVFTRRDGKANRPIARQRRAPRRRQRDAGAAAPRRSRRRPPAPIAAHQARFTLRREVKDDAERHRRPRATATAARRRLLAAAHWRTRAGTANSERGQRAQCRPRPRARAADRPGRGARCPAVLYLAVVCHCAPPAR